MRALRHEEEAFDGDFLLAGDADAELRVVDVLEGGLEARKFFAGLVERGFGDALVLHGVEAAQTTDGIVGGDGRDDFIEVGDTLFGVGDFLEEAIFELLEGFGGHCFRTEGREECQVLGLFWKRGRFRKDGGLGQ